MLRPELHMVLRNTKQCLAARVSRAALLTVLLCALHPGVGAAQEAGASVTPAGSSGKTPAAKQSTGKLEVSGDVPGASVHLDDTRVGEVPTLVENLAPGVHRLLIMLDGRPLVRTEIVISAGEAARLRVDPPKPTGDGIFGSLRVFATVSDVVVRIDGDDLGAPPIVQRNVQPGDHTVEIVRAGKVLETRVVSVTHSQEQTLQFDIDGPGQRRLEVTSDVRTARVRIDGQDRGPVPLRLGGQAQGLHRIEVTADGYATFSQHCEILPNRDCLVHARLRPLGIRVEVESDIPGSELSIDGRFGGVLPFAGHLLPGPHRLEVSAPGHPPRSVTFALSRGQPARHIRVSFLEPQRNASLSVGTAASASQEQPADDRPANRFVRSAVPMARGHYALSIYSGFPYLGQVGFDTGLVEHAGLHMSLGTFGRLTTGRAAILVGARFGRFGLGIEPEIEMGAGPDSVAAFSAGGRLRSSLYLRRLASLGLDLGLHGYRDYYPFEATDRNMPRSPGAQSGVRFTGGLRMEVRAGARAAIWAEADILLAHSGSSRRVYGDILGINGSDTGFYFRLGASLKN